MVYYYYVVPYTYVWCCPQPYAWFCPQHLLMAWSRTLTDGVVPNLTHGFVPNTYSWRGPQHFRMMLSPTLTDGVVPNTYVWCCPQHLRTVPDLQGAVGGNCPWAPRSGPPLQVWNLQMWTVSLTHTGHIVTYYHYYALAALPFNGEKMIIC